MNNRAIRTYIFYCSNSIDQNELERGCDGLEGITVKTISLPCSGKVDIPYLVKAFETGADGVVIVTCKENECRHLEGNLRAHKRAEAVESLLEEIGMSKGRMAVIQSKGKEEGFEETFGSIKKFFEKVRNLSQGCAEVSPLADRRA
jgi:F420-non-reducing hydrogenase iron-sulfur subunit